MSRSLYSRLALRYRPEASGFDRREFLQLTLAASAGLLMSCATHRDGNFRGVRPNGRKILVVGAGFAGLACAYELLSAGYRVSVVEARKRVGGRVLSFRDFIEGKNVEGGAELIGSNHPTWVAYSKRFGLGFLDVTENKDLHEPILIGGQLLTEKEGKALFEEMEGAFATMTSDARAVDADEPWKTANASKLDHRSTLDWLNALTVSSRCRAAMESELSANNCVSIARQSYLGNLTQVKGGGLEKYWTESEVYRCLGGNQQLAMKLAAAIGPERLVLDKPVSAIKVEGDHVSVTCANGQVLEMDEVVLAVPPSVWGRIKFDPELPAALHPQMGVGVKYLAAMKTRFWKKSKLAPDSLTDGMVSMTWDGTDGQRGEKGVCLTAFSGGPAAETCVQRWTESQDQAYREELGKLYPDFNANFVRSRFMNWPGEEWTGASYSFPAPGQVTTVGPLLHQGFGRVHFAGEHACYKFVGYMEGALNSGVSLAKRLALRDGVIGLPSL